MRIASLLLSYNKCNGIKDKGKKKQKPIDETVRYAYDRQSIEQTQTGDENEKKTGTCRMLGACLKMLCMGDRPVSSVHYIGGNDECDATLWTHGQTQEHHATIFRNKNSARTIRTSNTLTNGWLMCGRM